MKYLLALDQGTTSSRAIVFSERLEVIAQAQQPFQQIFPKPGWVEHDPEELWQSQFAVARAALQRAAIDLADLAAIGITNQRETSVFWDRSTGTAIGNAIVWQDRRAAALCDSLRHTGVEPEIQRRSGLVLDSYFSAGKIRWLLDNHPEARRLAAAGRLAFGTIDSWLIHRLTAGRAHLTDPSNASRTQLYDLASGSWSDYLLRLWGIPDSILPDIVASSGICGETSLFGDRAIPIAGIAGDQQAALFGQCCFRAGMAKCTYGTGCFILAHTGTRPVASSNRLLTTVAWSLGAEREFAIEGSVFNGGATVQWLRDGLGIIADAAAIETLAASATDTDGVVVVPAFTGLGAPYWDPAARGAVFGLTRGTGRAQLARAVLEGIAMQVADVCEAMRVDRGEPITELRVDGGAAANNLLMQLQADVLQTTLSRSAITESTAAGAAALAGLGVGLWSGRDALVQLWREQRQFHPEQSAAEVHGRRARWQAAVHATRLFGTDSPP